MKSPLWFGQMIFLALCCSSTLGLVACGDETPAPDGDADVDGDGDGDVDGDADVDGDIDGDVDGDVDGDADGDVDGDVDGDADADEPVDADEDEEVIEGCPPGVATCGEVCCEPGELCRYGHCIPNLGGCFRDDDCHDDAYCIDGGCVPYGVGPRGRFDESCIRPIEISRFAAIEQCRTAPPPGSADSYRWVGATPVVVDFDLDHRPGTIRPSIVFPTHLSDDWDGNVLRIVDGETCEEYQALTGDDDRVGRHTPAVGDLDGDGHADIVALGPSGSPDVRAFFYEPLTRQFERAWTAAPLGSLAYSTAPSIYDVNNDGQPEVLVGGAVVNGQTGEVITSALGGLEANGTTHIPVVADVDGDGVVELLAGNGTWQFDPILMDWAAELAYTDTPSPPGFVALADFGEFPGAIGDAPGRPEVVVVSRDTSEGRTGGTIRVQTYLGDVVWGPIDIPLGSGDRERNTGGPPNVGDFDGDGRPEIATAGGYFYVVADLDCAEVGAVGDCASGTTDGILWSQPSQDHTSYMTGSSVFDFDADGAAEAVYADECFLRVYDGTSGDVIWSISRSSGTGTEYPLIADVDGDGRSEVVLPLDQMSSCPDVDPIHMGLTCIEDSDCPSTRPGSCLLGFCRCHVDFDCGGRYRCSDAVAGVPVPARRICRARFFANETGVIVYRDVLDRWAGSRPVWNQHAYSVTNVEEDGSIPATADVEDNWVTEGLNNFRQNVQGDLGSNSAPDATGGGLSFDCILTASGDTFLSLFANVCNRGTEALPSEMTVGFYQTAMPDAGGVMLCSTSTSRVLEPGGCETVNCQWSPGVTVSEPFDVFLVVDDEDEGFECNEGNNWGRRNDVFCEGWIF